MFSYNMRQASGGIGISWDFLCSYLTQQTKRTGCCVLRTPTILIIPEPQYLILSTSPVFATGGTLSTTTTGLILRILWGILVTLGLDFVKWRCKNIVCFHNRLPIIGKLWGELFYGVSSELSGRLL
uniref:Uncharacterized protein LOC111111753 n=1 Tax=Crassostrea virginica TaxID=6565 RepID=A0A8B8BNY4_CRAVI|nr:uncharacterized protein LOC111111753 [Crassostrea virginica]